MKNLITLLLFSLTTTIHISYAQESVPFIEKVNAKAFKQLIEQGNYILLDVRTPEEVASGCIPNASSVNYYAEDFQDKIKLIPKDKNLLIYCKSGGRSSEAAKILLQNGFLKIYNLDGGIMAWEKEHFETTKGTTTTKSDAISYNLEELNELIEKKKIVFIDINTKWCAPCKKMAPLFDEIDSIYTNDNTEIFKIDADQNPSITKELKIESVPVFILYHQGVEVWRKQGIISKEEISEKLESYAN